MRANTNPFTPHVLLKIQRNSKPLRPPPVRFRHSMASSLSTKPRNALHKANLEHLPPPHCYCTCRYVAKTSVPRHHQGGDELTLQRSLPWKEGHRVHRARPLKLGTLRLTVAGAAAAGCTARLGRLIPPRDSLMDVMLNAMLTTSEEHDARVPMNACRRIPRLRAPYRADPADVAIAAA